VVCGGWERLDYKIFLVWQCEATSASLLGVGFLSELKG
jgi:hypothetical protein